ncbi:MAG TPA: ABC transporter ATP-binding protein, partial [Clostridiaceae bacterium]|nr:ABC transporter ATP-binding protein [Clostridiaceae bacterium]
ARAFAGDPKIIFADEPTGNLDTTTSLEVMDLITQMIRDKNQTLIMVTHDEEMTENADRLLHMRDGKIEHSHSRAIPLATGM